MWLDFYYIINLIKYIQNIFNILNIFFSKKNIRLVNK